MESKPENDGYAELSLRDRKLLCDAAARGEYIESVLNDPTGLAAGDAVQELFRLERKAKPIQRRLEIVSRAVEGVSFYTPPLEDGSYIALGVNLGRSLEDMLREFQQVERSLRSVLSSLPIPPRLRPFQREARDAWLRFYEGDCEPLDRFIRKYLVRLKNHRGPVPDRYRERVLRVLDRCFIMVPFYSAGAWFYFGPAAQEQLIAFTEKSLMKFGSLAYDTEAAERLPGATLQAWEEIQWAGGSTTLLSRVDKHLGDEIDENPRLLQTAEERPHSFLDEIADDALAEFEAREATQRQVSALPQLVERAAFSATEQLVYSFDQRVGTDFETLEEAGEAAAHALNGARATVRVHRFNYRKKLNKAIASDPSFQGIFEGITLGA